MAEKTLALPLSGAEVVEAICERVRVALKKDCFLSETSAYDWFEASVSVGIRLHDLGRIPKVEVGVVVEKGAWTGDVEERIAGVEIGRAAPNQVRLENGLPVPVLATGADGRKEIRRVKYRLPVVKE